MIPIDLRSDTVTRPTLAMREAMFYAEVGDDGYGEDPTVNRLEQLAAELCGKEAGLFVSSGTQGNQIAVMVHAGRGQEVICDYQAHMFNSETGGISALSGAQPCPVMAPDGKLTPELIEPAIRERKMNAPQTALITVENTHNAAGGVYYTPAELGAVHALAAEYGIPVHMDGARVANAAVAQGLPLAELARHADSMQMCLSKGLCAPVGSVLVGSAEFIRQARRYRRLLGGGMRQAGILAAAGIVALETMLPRLADDHRNAGQLAQAIATTRLRIDLERVQTNIVLFDTAPLGVSAAEFIVRLREHGILAGNAYGRNKVRMVTHHDVSAGQIEYTISVIQRLAGEAC